MAWLGRKVHSRTPVNQDLAGMVLHPLQHRFLRSPEGVREELQAIPTQPLVLLTWRIIEHGPLAALFGFKYYEWVPHRDVWTNGPEVYGLSDDEWRTRVIIVEKPWCPRRSQRQARDAFLALLVAMTGRTPETGPRGHLIFR